MDIQYKTREDMVKDAEIELRKFQRGIENGFWVGMGYTEGEIQSTLEMMETEVKYLKKECSFTEYHIAYTKARIGRGDC